MKANNDPSHRQVLPLELSLYIGHDGEQLAERLSLPAFPLDGLVVEVSTFNDRRLDSKVTHEDVANAIDAALLADAGRYTSVETRTCGSADDALEVLFAQF